MSMSASATKLPHGGTTRSVSKITRVSSAPALLPRLGAKEKEPEPVASRLVKAEEHMYVQVRRGHWQNLSPDCKLWTLREFALEHPNWEAFSDKGKLRVIYELGSLLTESGDQVAGGVGAVTKARNELQSSVQGVRCLHRAVRSDPPRALAIANLCEGSLNLPGASRRIKEALGWSAKLDEFDPGHVEQLSKKFKFRGYIALIEHRAITVAQLRKVIKHCQSNIKNWREDDREDRSGNIIRGKSLAMDTLNLYHVNKWVIGPCCETSRCSLVETVAEQDQPAVWFVSHHWGQPQLSFFKSVENHLSVRGLHHDTGYWIWAYAQRMHALEKENADPRFSSLGKAIELAEFRTLLILENKEESEKHVSGGVSRERLWCSYEVLTSLDKSVSNGLNRIPMDIATCKGDSPELITYDLTEAEEATENRFPGSGCVLKSAREKTFPLTLVERCLRHSVENAQTSLEADRAHLLNAIAGKKDVNEPASARHGSYSQANAKLDGIFALAFLHRIVQDEAEDAKQAGVDLELLKLRAAQALRSDLERTAIDVSLGGGKGASVNEELALLMKNLPPKLSKVTFDTKGSGLKNATLAELANYLSSEVQDITLDLQGCRGINDGGLKGFMDNLMTTCSDRSKLEVLSCLTIGTKVAEACQEACEYLSVGELENMREDLELQERKNYITRLMKYISLGKTPILCIKKLLERDTEITVTGTMGEVGSITVSHTAWDLHSKEMEIMIDDVLIKVILENRGAMEFRKRPGAAPYSVMWPVPTANPETYAYEVSHRIRKMADKWAEQFKNGESESVKAVSKSLFEFRAGDLVEASVPMKTKTLKTSMIYACRDGSLASITGLLHYGKCECILEAIDAAEWEDEDLQEYGLKREDAPSGTALMGATEVGETDIVEKLLEYSIDFDAPHHQSAQTPLHAAAKKGRSEAAQLLIGAGANADALDGRGRVPLHWAAIGGHAQLVEIIIKQGVDVDYKDYEGLTPMMHAAVNGQLLAFQKLLEYGADFRAVHSSGKRVVDFAQIVDTEKLAMQQKKQHILDALQKAESELLVAEQKEREERERAERAAALAAAAAAAAEAAEASELGGAVATSAGAMGGVPERLRSLHRLLAGGEVSRRRFVFRARWSEALR
eukprot:TRINITY_DN6004_c1_g2_i1.p1 TRINITY_DN6004_c1_g2~~TRINITY_DN6004_c1_g2_i1.p1  ORF type:complete len:1131 (-),score=249.58 TRINITY_DN6004_c1_g2_i1:561-3953(-)